jgi:hypothetical protein
VLGRDVEGCGFAAQLEVHQNPSLAGDGLIAAGFILSPVGEEGEQSAAHPPAERR